MRLTTMVSGTWVTVAMNASVAVPKAKPMGTPHSTIVARPPTKNTTRFQLPIAFSQSPPKCNAAAPTAMAAAAIATLLQPSLVIRIMQVASISRQPTGMAAARTMLERPSAGVSIYHSSAA